MMEWSNQSLIGRLEEKVKEYCDNNPDSNLHALVKNMEIEVWNLVAMLYGQYINDHTDLETEELSEQEWT